MYRSSCDNNQQYDKQVYVTCNFCGKSIAYNMLATRNRHFMFGGMTAHKPKVSLNSWRNMCICAYFAIISHLSSTNEVIHVHIPSNLICKCGIDVHAV